MHRAARNGDRGRAGAMMEASMHLGTHDSCGVMLVVLSALGRFNYQSQPPQLVKAMYDSPMPPPPFMAKSSPSPDTSGSTVSTTSAIAQAHPRDHHRRRAPRAPWHASTPLHVRGPSRV